MANKEDGIKQKLIRLVTLAPYEDRTKTHVLFVSIDDSYLFEDAIERGELGDKSRELYMVEGLRFVYPLFMGYTVFWYSNNTKFCLIDNLTKEELLLLIDKQKEHIKLLYNRRVVIHG